MEPMGNRRFRPGSYFFALDGLHTAVVDLAVLALVVPRLLGSPLGLLEGLLPGFVLRDPVRVHGVKGCVT